VTYFIDKQKIKFSELHERLKALSPGKVTLRVDKNIPHGLVLEVITVCQKSGIENVSFSYKSQQPSRSSSSSSR
jgi:biopolymer transport protein ExbD